MPDLSRLPVPVTESWDWQLRAACRGLNSEWFFHRPNERGAERQARESRAKAVCMGCPVRRECQEHALTVEEHYGVWGGLTEHERRKIFADRRPNPT